MPEPTPPEPTPPTPTPPAKPAWWQGLIPTNWRELVGWLSVMLLSTALNRWVLPPGVQLPIPDPPVPHFTPPPDGWHPPTEDQRQDTFRALRVPRFRLTEAGQEVVGDADSPVWRLAAKGRAGVIPTRDQGQIGSCVSFGFSTAVEYTMGSQVALSKQRQDLPDSCQEALYGGSRVEANGGRVPFSGDGSTGAWAAKWLETIGGVLPRGTYGTLDLTRYDVARCRQWGDRGVPNELEAECKKHPAHCALVSTTAELKTALAQGYAVAVCSNVGFESNTNGEGKPTRDADGFLRASGQWGHCMAVIGYRADKNGFLIMNSWGPNWVAGPKGFGDEPDGAFWAREADVQRILSEQDSYAVANADGFKRRQIAPIDWLIQNHRRPVPAIALQRGIGHAFLLAP